MNEIVLTAAIRITTSLNSRSSFFGRSEVNFFKTKFIQICRWLGYEIIDQNSFEVPTLNKRLNQSLGVPGKKSISIPL